MVPESITHESLLDLLNQHISSHILSHSIFRDQLTIDIMGSSIQPVLEFLKTNSDVPFDLFVDISAIDYLTYPEPQRERFAVIYVLNSRTRNYRIVVRAFVSAEDPSLPTSVPIYQGADWAEREVYDLFGITFEGHPDLRRILVPEYFQHHPLRKDYPVKGLGERSQFEKIKREQFPEGQS